MGENVEGEKKKKEGKECEARKKMEGEKKKEGKEYEARKKMEGKERKEKKRKGEIMKKVLVKVLYEPNSFRKEELGW